MSDKERHRRHRSHGEIGRELVDRFSCVSREVLAEEKREGKRATGRKARIARNRAAKKH